MKQWEKTSTQCDVWQYFFFCVMYSFAYIGYWLYEMQYDATCAWNISILYVICSYNTKKAAQVNKQFILHCLFIQFFTFLCTYWFFFFSVMYGFWCVLDCCFTVIHFVLVVWSLWIKKEQNCEVKTKEIFCFILLFFLCLYHCFLKSKYPLYIVEFL